MNIPFPPAVMVAGTPTSPSGLFRAELTETPHPRIDNATQWSVVIHDLSGQLVYQDKEGARAVQEGSQRLPTFEDL